MNQGGRETKDEAECKRTSPDVSSEPGVEDALLSVTLEDVRAQKSECPSHETGTPRGPMASSGAVGATGVDDGAGRRRKALRRAKLESILREYGMVEPNRGDFSAYPEHVWREGIPDYTKANLAYVQGRTKNHAEDSLERIVENLVKTWEMEATHVSDPKEWKTVDHDVYNVSANGGVSYNLTEAARVGNYNWLLASTNPEVYDVRKESFESSHSLFGNAFTEGFPWEVLEVFSGPPEVAFTWRHWASFTGEFRGNQGENQIVEMYGLCLATVNTDLKIQRLQVFYKPESFFDVLLGKARPDTLSGGKALVGSGCPFIPALSPNASKRHETEAKLPPSSKSAVEPRTRSIPNPFSPTSSN